MCDQWSLYYIRLHNICQIQLPCIFFFQFKTLSSFSLFFPLQDMRGLGKESLHGAFGERDSFGLWCYWHFLLLQSSLSSSASFSLNPLLKKRLGREHQSHFTDVRTEAQMACRDWTEHKADHFGKRFPSGTQGQQNRKETLYPFLMINISNAPGWPRQIWNL